MKIYSKINQPAYWLTIITLIALLFSPTSFSAKKALVIPDVSLKSKTNASKTRTSSAQTTTFSQNEIDDSPVNDISELLEQQQSVVHLTSSSGDTTQTALSIRGFGDNAVANTLILIDGFPLTNPTLLAPNFNSIPLSDIKRITIFQGSQGSLWGNQAVGGVVNIITRHPKRLFANSVVSIGSYHSYYFNVLTGDKFENGFFIKLFGLLSKTRNHRDHNTVSGDNVAAQAGMDYARGTFVINLQKYQNTTDFPGGLSQQQMDEDPHQATDQNSFSHYRTELIQLLSKHEIVTDWLLETRLSQYATNGDGKVFIDFTRRDSTLAFNPRLIGNIYDSKLIIGYDGQLSNYRMINKKVNAKTTAKQNDVYAQFTIPFTAELDFILGARGAIQGNKIEARIDQPFHTTNKVFVSEQGFKYHPTNNLSFYVRRDGNFRFPKANEQVSAVKASESLHTQTGVSYETGAEWKNDYSKTQVNLYRLELNKEIAFNPEQTAAHPFGAWSNLDRTLRYGASISESYSINSHASTNGQINYVNARFSDGANSGKHIPAVPAITGNAGLDYNWTRNWQTKYFLTYTGTRYASEDVQNIGAKLGSYWLHNLAIQYTYKNIMLNAEVMNIFNKSYATYAYYNPDNGANVFYPSPGRNYLLTMKVNFD